MGPPGKVCYFGGRMAETCEQQMDRVQEAIAAIEAGTATRYTIGNHSLTKHNPQTLYNREERLLCRIANSGDTGTRVAQVSGDAGNPGRNGPVSTVDKVAGVSAPGPALRRERARVAIATVQFGYDAVASTRLSTRRSGLSGRGRCSAYRDAAFDAAEHLSRYGPQ